MVTGDPVILWPWVWVAVGVVILAVGAAGWVVSGRRRASRQEATWVANSAYLAKVPAFRAWLRRYRLWRALLAAGLLVAVLGAGALAARPARTDTVVERLGTRDIVLCLDVSGSMTDYDGAVLEVFQRMVDSFQGERIALSVFNSTSRTVFPLTDDYTLVQEELQRGIEALESVDSLDPEDEGDAEDILEYLQFTAGTWVNQDGASLIGDGLASCGLLFDEADTERSRSIVLATDNYVSGEPIYSLGQAADLVRSRDITLYGIFGGDREYWGGPEELEYKGVVEAGDGLYFRTDDPALVRSMVDDVVAQQAVELDAAPEVIVTDLPREWYLVIVAGVTALVLAAWRLRE
ncbi:VWA domain-containing protein [Antribacter gilvus]|uniref:VWA domain-containing protein n=1 Tax=Antribacter gilvus TaxID=2304675 RepID=UPI000F7720AB|nr:VWA domain-containing protein [Antribacter gilvus]